MTRSDFGLLEPTLQSMSTREAVHVAGNAIVILRPKDEVDVVRHQVVPDHTHRDLDSGVLHEVEKLSVITVVMEEPCSVVPPVEHVVHGSSEDLSTGSGHWILSLNAVAIFKTHANLERGRGPDNLETEMRNCTCP